MKQIPPKIISSHLSDLVLKSILLDEDSAHLTGTLDGQSFIDVPSRYNSNETSQSTSRDTDGGSIWNSFPERSWLKFLTSTQPSSGVDSIFTKKYDPIIDVNNAESYEEIFQILAFLGYHRMATRLRYLYETTQEEGIPEDESRMDFLSLKKLTSFFVREDTSLPYPAIGICPDSSLQAEWYCNKGFILMNFLPDGNIEFAALAKHEDSSESLHGSGQSDIALQAIQPFFDKYQIHDSYADRR